MFQGVIEDCLLDVLGHPVRMRSTGAGQTVDQALGAMSLEVAPDLIELLA